MRCISALLFLVCACNLPAQTGTDPQVSAAQVELEKVRAMVDAGALPRVRLAKAEDALADAQDAAFLRKTAYGADLAADQADEMIAVAGRRVARRQKDLDEARKLVEAGVAPSTSLAALEVELDRARQETEVANSRAQIVRELSAMAGAEESFLAKLAQSPAEATEMAVGFNGDGIFAYSTYAKVEVAFEEHFGKAMPVSAVGETAVHRALGFDHRGRVDVAIHPDEPEGVWLIHYLTDHRIPYFAFRQAVKGKATGAHIHIGPMSTKLVSGG